MARTKTTWGKDHPPPKSPGRPKMTETECRLREYMDTYLDSQAAIDDFEALRKEDPGKALIYAMERKYGKPKETLSAGDILTLAQIRAELLGMETPPEEQS